MKRFHHDRILQVYVPAFVYVDTETMPVKDHFPAIKTWFVNYNKILTPVTLPKYWLVFSYIHSE